MKIYKMVLLEIYIIMKKKPDSHTLFFHEKKMNKEAYYNNFSTDIK